MAFVGAVHISQRARRTSPPAYTDGFLAQQPAPYEFARVRRVAPSPFRCEPFLSKIIDEGVFARPDRKSLADEGIKFATEIRPIAGQRCDQGGKRAKARVDSSSGKACALV
jgi:hypothetical protein